MGIEPGSIPLIAAGGINSHEKLKRVLALGAVAAQLGTPFAVTEEGDAHPNFKKVLADAAPDDIVTFMSDAGLPARAVRTPWLTRYLDGPTAAAEGPRQPRLRDRVGLPDPVRPARRQPAGRPVLHRPPPGRGAPRRRRARPLLPGAEPLPFGNAIRPVSELVDYFLTGIKPGTERVGRPAGAKRQPCG